MNKKAVDYTKAKYLLTNAIRTIEKLMEYQKRHNHQERVLSEEEYWLSSLELIRMGLYEESVTNEQQRNERVKDAIIEVKDEMAAMLSVHKPSALHDFELKELSIAWTKCKEAGELL